MPANAQGELQGANASLMSLAAVVAPLVMPLLFGYFSREDAVIFMPGAAFLAAALLSIVAVALMLVTTRHETAPAADVHAASVQT